MQVSPGMQRAIAAAIIAPAAAMSLPLSAMFLDDRPGAENLIFPAQVVGMGAIGATVGATMPRIFGPGVGRAGAAGLGAGAALGAALVADAVFFKVIAG